MDNQVETTGRTVDEAIESALNQLGVPSDETTIEVLEEPRSGLFGIGSRLARVRVSLKGPQAAPAAAPVEDKKPAPKAAPAKADKPAPKANVSAPAPAEAAAKAAVKETPQPASQEDMALAEEKATAFLGEVTRAMGINATFATKPKDGGLYIEIAGPQMGRIIGHRGETLDALQYLTAQVVGRSVSGVRVWLDAENYRAKRQDMLERMAKKAADRASRTGYRVPMDPMNPAERRIVHTALQDYPGVITKSEGEEPYRRVIVMPR
nr:protein jag [bacterium]